MNSTIPICFYPMQKIILDDDQAFAQSIMLTLRRSNFTNFNLPTHALNYLLNEYSPTFTKSDLFTPDSENENSSTQYAFNININKLKQMLLENHNDQINVLFVDYHMPEMTGLDFLKKINHLKMKKVLLTGEQDANIAINAFNEGLVDAYIKKDDPSLTQKIQAILTDMEWKYFTDLSQFFTSMPEFNYLQNEKLAQEFMQFVNDNNIIAFCLADRHGSFITRDKEGQIKYFLIRNKKYLQTLATVAKEDGGSLETIQQLERMNVIPFFGDKDYWQVPASEWDQYLYSIDGQLEDSDLVWTTIHYDDIVE